MTYKYNKYIKNARENDRVIEYKENAPQNK